MKGKLLENQSTQKFVPLNYSIGKIDDEVRNLVFLNETQMIYLESVININFGSDNIGSDNIGLGDLLRNQLYGISSRGLEQKIIVAEKLSSNTNLIRVLYKQTKNDVLCSVIILKNEIIQKKIELKGKNSKEGIKNLSEKIISEFFK